MLCCLREDLSVCCAVVVIFHIFAETDIRLSWKKELLSSVTRPAGQTTLFDASLSALVGHFRDMSYELSLDGECASVFERDHQDNLELPLEAIC